MQGMSELKHLAGHLVWLPCGCYFSPVGGKILIKMLQELQEAQNSIFAIPHWQTPGLKKRRNV